MTIVLAILAALCVLAAAVAVTGAVIVWDWAADRRAQRQAGTPDAFAALRADVDRMADRAGLVAARFDHLVAELAPHLAGAAGHRAAAQARHASLAVQARARQAETELAEAREQLKHSDGQGVTLWLRAVGGIASLDEARSAWGDRCDRLFRIACELGEIEPLARTDGQPGQLGWRATGGAITLQLRAVTEAAA